MIKNLAFLFLLVTIICNAQNTTNEKPVHTTTENDSIYICPFPTNCGYYKGEFIYEGVTKIANGKGKANLRGNIAEGNWKNNKLEGSGTYEVKNGFKYIGNFKDGQFFGQGSIFYNIGNKYVGEWKDNKFYGQGVFYTSNGTKYAGKWSSGIGNDLGFVIFIKNSMYTGTKYNGKGTRINQNGDVYTGNF